MTKRRNEKNRAAIHLPIPDERISLKADLHSPLPSLSLFRTVLPAFASPFSCDVHTYLDDGLMLDLLQVQATARQQQTKDDEGMQWSEISLTIQPFHYANGRLNLRCTANIPGIYLRYSELNLLSNMGEPVPAKGNYKNFIFFSHNVLKTIGFIPLCELLLTLDSPL